MTGASTRSTVVHHTLWYAFCVYAAQFAGILTGVAMRKYLGPGDMGLWVMLQTLMGYALMAELGVLTALTAQLPASVARGAREEERKIEGASFAFVLMVGTLAGAALLAWAAWQWRGGDRLMAAGFASMAVTVPLTLVYNFHVSRLWGRHGFGILGWGILLNTALQIAWTFLLIRTLGLPGVFISAAVSPAVCALFVAASGRCWPKPIADFGAIGKLLAYGFPIYVSGFFYTFLISVDRWVIATGMGTEPLGVYSLAIMAFTFSSVAPRMLSIVLFPRMQERYAGSGRASDLTGLVVKPDLVVAFLSPPILGAVYLALPLLTHFWLERFEGGVAPARILLLGSFFLSLVYNAQSFLITVGRRLQLVPFVLAAIAVAAGAGLGLVRAGWGLNGAATGMGIAFFLYFAAINGFTLRIAMKPSAVALHLAEITAAFLYFGAAVFLLSQWHPSGQMLGDTAARILGLALLWVPPAWWVDRRTGAIREVWNLALERWRKKR